MASEDVWKNDAIQFPRLLAEIWAAGLSEKQIGQLCESMTLQRSDLEELFDRADQAWEFVQREWLIEK